MQEGHGWIVTYSLALLNGRVALLAGLLLALPLLKQGLRNQDLVLGRSGAADSISMVSDEDVSPSRNCSRWLHSRTGLL
jgi:hypothetical protein